MEPRRGRINSHRDLEVFQKAFATAMELFRISRRFPKEEMYSLTDQLRRSGRSTAANITEAWRKRRYEAAFISKLSDAEAEAAETQTWVEFARECGYLDSETAGRILETFEEILRMLVSMIHNSEKWTLPGR